MAWLRMRSRPPYLRRRPLRWLIADSGRRRATGSAGATISISRPKSPGSMGLYIALDRTQPLLPLQPDPVERRTHEYKCNVKTSLFAALELKPSRLIRHCIADIARWS